jgi:hypothetical protein
MMNCHPSSNNDIDKGKTQQIRPKSRSNNIEYHILLLLFGANQINHLLGRTDHHRGKIAPLRRDAPCTNNNHHASCSLLAQQTITVQEDLSVQQTTTRSLLIHEKDITLLITNNIPTNLSIFAHFGATQPH